MVGNLNPNLVPTTDNEANAFFGNVLRHKPCVLSLLAPYCDSYIPTESEEATSLDIPGLSILYKPENEELTYKELLDVGEDIVFELTSEQICEIEKHTRAQHGCDLWFKHSAGQITASKMKAACHTDPASPLDKTDMLSETKQFFHFSDKVMKTWHVNFISMKCKSSTLNLNALQVAW